MGAQVRLLVKLTARFLALREQGKGRDYEDLHPSPFTAAPEHVSQDNEDAAGPRDLNIDGARTTLASETRTIALPATQPSTSAQIDDDDRWPENNAMSIVEPPPANTERWWIGEGPPSGWRTF